jgi:hypothetical protein
VTAKKHSLAPASSPGETTGVGFGLTAFIGYAAAGEWKNGLVALALSMVPYAVKGLKRFGVF